MPICVKIQFYEDGIRNLNQKIEFFVPSTRHQNCLGKSLVNTSFSARLMQTYFWILLISCLKFFCFEKKFSKYSFKFIHWSKHQRATYFIDSNLVSVCFLAYSATTFVIDSKDVWSSLGALKSLKKKWMSLKKSSRSKCCNSSVLTLSL